LIDFDQMNRIVELIKKIQNLEWTKTFAELEKALELKEY